MIRKVNDKLGGQNYSRKTNKKSVNNAMKLEMRDKR